MNRGLFYSLLLKFVYNVTTPVSLLFIFVRKHNFRKEPYFSVFNNPFLIKKSYETRGVICKGGTI